MVPRWRFSVMPGVYDAFHRRPQMCGGISTLLHPGWDLGLPLLLVILLSETDYAANAEIRTNQLLRTFTE